MTGTTTARSDDDSGDIASSVGATAVMVAAARAAETRGQLDPEADRIMQ
ncbi:O-methyltransferase involved in polyketide biosynthesis [Mycobacteroides chelonae]|nr:O-methyltransferase involved in polyketide biosynthesis [Mycobacteroides chelonae]